MKTFWTVKEIEKIIRANVVKIWEEDRWICMQTDTGWRIKIRKF